VYHPVTLVPPAPVVVYLHGGGWVLCGLETHDTGCRTLADRLGAVVISVDYRRAPEDQFPAAAEDSYAATVWAAGQARELGGDPARMVVAGDSAGGNLAAAVALMARDRGGPAIAYQLLVYPVIDVARNTMSYRENATGYYLTAQHMQWYWEQYLGPADGHDPYASPIYADLAGLPPALIVTAEHDPLRDEGEAYAEALQRAGVDATARRYAGMFHGFFNMTEHLAGARDASNDVVAILGAALR
jgi:acetyl esterase